MAMIGTFNAEDVADYIDYTNKVLAAAEECSSDNWVVIWLSPRKAALITGEGMNLVPEWETVLARKSFGSEPEFFV